MKILCLADVHGYLDGIVKARNYIIKHGIRYVFLLGDFSIGFKDPRQNEADIDYSYKVLKSNAKVWGMPGNCDHPTAIEYFKKKKSLLHDNVLTLGETRYIGHGGSNPTPFGTPTEYDEKEIYDNLKRLLESVKGSKKVLVTHFPPKDTNCDMIAEDLHVGSESLRKIIEEYEPTACVCSHIHESAGREDTIGSTRIINVGTLAHGNAVVIESNGEVVITRASME